MLSQAIIVRKVQLGLFDSSIREHGKMQLIYTWKFICVQKRFINI